MSGVIDSVLDAVANSKARTAEAQTEMRQQIQSLTPSSASLEVLKNAVHFFGPAQLIADRRKSHSNVRLTRKMLASCGLMSAAFDIVRKAEELMDSGSTVEKISKCLQIDRRSSLPHVKWTTNHDAVLVHAIVTHGWFGQNT